MGERAEQPAEGVLADVVIERRILVSSAGSREYVLVKPVTGGSRELPLIVELHGSGFDPADQLRVSRSARLAARGAVVALPRGKIRYSLMAGWPRGYAWNVPGSPLPGETEPRREPDDVRFIAELVAAVVSAPDSDLRIAPDRVHVIGYSGGARLASHLAAQVPGLASVACVAGVRHPGNVTDNTVAIIAVHGADDPVNPYLGGAGSRWSTSVPESVSEWARASRCAMTPSIRAIADGVREVSYLPALGGAPVRLAIVANVGHAWPGTRDPDHLARFGAAGSFDVTDYLGRLLLDPGLEQAPAGRVVPSTVEVQQ
jgi:polyhydroxybutyrate depolymerase